MADKPKADGSKRVPLSEIYFQRAADFRKEADRMENKGEKDIALDLRVKAYSCESQGHMANGNLQKAYESVSEGIALYVKNKGKTVLELEIQKKFTEGYIALNQYNTASAIFAEALELIGELRKSRPERSRGLGFVETIMAPMILQEDWKRAIQKSDWMKVHQLTIKIVDLFEKAASITEDHSEAILNKVMAVRVIVASSFSETVDFLDQWDIKNARNLLNDIKNQLDNPHVNELLSWEPNEIVKIPQDEFKAIKALVEGVDNLIELREHVSSNKPISGKKKETLKKLDIAQHKAATIEKLDSAQKMLGALPGALIDWNKIAIKLKAQAENIYALLNPVKRLWLRPIITFVSIFVILNGLTLLLTLLNVKWWMIVINVVVSLALTFGIRETRELLLSLAEFFKSIPKKKD